MRRDIEERLRSPSSGGWKTRFISECTTSSTTRPIAMAVKLLVFHGFCRQRTPSIIGATENRLSTDFAVLL
jgi:hypothetical protein